MILGQEGPPRLGLGFAPAGRQRRRRSRVAVLDVPERRLPDHHLEHRPAPGPFVGVVRSLMAGR